MNIRILTPTLLLYLLVLVSCGTNNTENDTHVGTSDTLKANTDLKNQEYLERRKKIEQEAYQDSLRLDRVLQEALKLATQHIRDNEYVSSYQVFPDSIPIKVTINLDHHFSSNISHLIVKLEEPTVNLISIYIPEDNDFRNVFSYDVWTMEYVNDTIWDINGDGRKDFVINTYGANGCCLKAFSDVYLLMADEKTFTEKINFTNPTFSPKEKIVRGVCYGHPGYTDIYKFRWKGIELDTVEYVSYERNEEGKTGKIIITTDISYSRNSKVIKRLNAVPEEYHKITGYDWFTANFK
jgi:hypothetical protein